MYTLEQIRKAGFDSNLEEYEIEDLFKSLKDMFPKQEIKVFLSILKDIKQYVISLDTPENTVYQENLLLIMNCFSKAMEIVENNFKK